MPDAMYIDDYDLAASVELAAAFGSDSYGYLVTPNVDHVIRHCRDAEFRALYAGASFVMLDSRLLAHLMRAFKRQRLRVCPGSDLTAALFGSVIEPSDIVVLVGGTAAQARRLREQFDLRALHHIAPPMHFIQDPAAVERCLSAIEAVRSFRFCFLAVGSPQQEIIARKLKDRGVARGLALCVGASINFLTGIERRAPQWMQRTGLEWLFRLLQNPRRLAARYLVRGPLLLALLWNLELRVRPRAAVTANGRAAHE